MKSWLTAAFAALACLPALTTIALAEEHGVPIVQAPFHLPVFKNDDVLLLNVTVPPGRNTGYHTHINDSVSVNIEEADMTNQPLGEPQAGPPRHSHRGQPNFTAFSKQPPRTHKASNVGPTPFHNIDVIFQKPQPAGFTAGSRAGVAGYTQIMDNERLRAWRVALEPGQSLAAITQQAPGLRIVIDGGIIAENVPGQPERGMLLKAGDFFWQDSGVTRAVSNTGTTRVEFLEYELK
jgi:quercetin dioxygenase-like cupin family protein